MEKSEPAKRVFVHIGLQKTGTSFLQNILFNSTEPLARQGLDLVPDTAAVGGPIARVLFWALPWIEGAFLPGVRVEFARLPEEIQGTFAVVPADPAG